MGSCYSNDRFAYTDKTPCKIEEPSQKYHLGTASNRLLGGLNMFYCTQTSPSASVKVQLNQNYHKFKTQHKTFDIYFYLFSIFITKQKRKHSGQL